MKSKENSDKPSYYPLNISLGAGQHFTLFPNDVVSLKHYNGFTIKFISPGYCKFVYRGGFGFDIVPFTPNEREINISLKEPPII